ncbi:hypothetical protein RN629_17675 [Sphingomonadaceae bacterium jetA1]|jgi:hypothetical protein|uniref:hypothetical protein n=1 Tax=Facivitalis istanbulensis TaxID=3075838 RepID=UPI00348A74D7
MAYIEGHARDQALLLPASVEDYVSPDNPVRFKSARAGGANVSYSEFDVQPWLEPPDVRPL